MVEVVDDLVKAMVAKRELMGLSQRELAKRLGMAWSAVARWERGQGVPGALARLKIRRWMAHDDAEPLPASAMVGDETLAQVARRVDRLERQIVELQRERASDAAVPGMSGVGESCRVSAPVGGEPLRQVHEGAQGDGRGDGGAAQVRAPRDW